MYACRERGPVIVGRMWMIPIATFHPYTRRNPPTCITTGNNALLLLVPYAHTRVYERT